MEPKIPAVNVYYCGIQNCEAGHFFGPATRPHYLMHFILKGQGTYQTEEQIFSLREGQAFLIKPGEVTYYQADEKEPWEYVWVAFDGVEAERLLEKYQLAGKEYICSYESVEMVRMWMNKLIELFMKSGYNKEVAIGYFYIIFGNIIKKNMPLLPDYEVTYYKKAEQYIRHHYSYPIHVTDIARNIGIDRTYLYKIFIKYANQSPKQFLTEFRIRVAKEMLNSTSMNITEIALSCGFNDSSMFCKHFHKLEKKSPMQYRNKAFQET